MDAVEILTSRRIARSRQSSETTASEAIALVAAVVVGTATGNRMRQERVRSL